MKRQNYRRWRNSRFRDDPPESREHYETCPAAADDGDEPGACTCADVDAGLYEDEMERRVDALRDRDL